MLKIACVLRSGGVYNAEWVWNLHRQIRDQGIDLPFVCITDINIKDLDFCDEVIPRESMLPGWWAKMELFNHRHDGDYLYLDLDTLVTGDMTPILHIIRESENLWMLRDFYFPETFNSGVMYIPQQAKAAIWGNWVAHWRSVMTEFRGDQDYIESIGRDIMALQDHIEPNAIVSWKGKELSDATEPPQANHIICFHGEPKQPQLESHPIVSRYWKSRPRPDTSIIELISAPSLAKPDVIEPRPLMALNQRSEILSSIPDNGSILEWGSGGTTLWLLRNLKPGQRLTSVEHSPEWSRDIDERAKKIAPHQYSHLFRPVAHEGANATPFEECPSGCDSYIHSPPHLDSFDVLLIDGIARGACLARALIQGFEGVVYVHDAHRDWLDWCLRMVEHVEIIHAAPGEYPPPLAKMVLGKGMLI
jgi:hypothetical protein